MNKKCKNSDRYINTNFRIGDIVKICNSGETYSSYQVAFNYFQIKKFNFKNFTTYWGGYNLKYPYSKNNEEITSWRVFDIGLHCETNDVLLFLINQQHHYGLIIGSSGCQLLLHTRKETDKDYFCLKKS